MILVKTGLALCLSVALCSSVLAKNSLTDFVSLTEQQRYQALDELIHDGFSDAENATKECQSNHQALLSASHDASYRVRNLVIILLSRCKEAPKAELIANRFLELIKSPDERSEVRDTILEALGGMGPLTEPIKTLLLDYAANSKGAIRRETATLALASFNVVDDDILDAINKLLNAERASSRVVALQSYRALTKPLLENPEKAKVILNNLYAKLPNQKIDFNQTAAYLIAELVPHSNDAIAILIEMIENSPFSRKSAAHALVAIGAPAKSVLPKMRLVLAQSTGFEKTALAQAVKALEEL